MKSWFAVYPQDQIPRRLTYAEAVRLAKEQQACRTTCGPSLIVEVVGKVVKAGKTGYIVKTIKEER